MTSHVLTLTSQTREQHAGEWAPCYSMLSSHLLQLVQRSYSYSVTERSESGWEWLGMWSIYPRRDGDNTSPFERSKRFYSTSTNNIFGRLHTARAPSSSEETPGERGAFPDSACHTVTLAQ